MVFDCEFEMEVQSLPEASNTYICNIASIYQNGLVFLSILIQKVKYIHTCGLQVVGIHAKIFDINDQKLNKKDRINKDHAIKYSSKEDCIVKGRTDHLSP